MLNSYTNSPCDMWSLLSDISNTCSQLVESANKILLTCSGRFSNAALPVKNTLTNLWTAT